MSAKNPYPVESVRNVLRSDGTVAEQKQRSWKKFPPKVAAHKTKQGIALKAEGATTNKVKKPIRGPVSDGHHAAAQSLATTMTEFVAAGGSTGNLFMKKSVGATRKARGGKSTGRSIGTL